jgi:hypothetical protein
MDGAVNPMLKPSSDRQLPFSVMPPTPGPQGGVSGIAGHGFKAAPCFAFQRCAA